MKFKEDAFLDTLFKHSTPWKLIEKSADAKTIKNNETLFSLSNGHIGIRGSLEEANKTPEYSHSSDVYMNGFYDTLPIQYGEWAYGYAKEEQTIVSLANGNRFEFAIDDETFDLNKGITHEHKRELDLKEGTLSRSLIWESSTGSLVKVNYERFVSYDFPEIIAQRIELTPFEDNKTIKIKAFLDDLKDRENSDLDNEVLSNDPRVKEQHSRRYTSQVIEHDEFILVELHTKSSHLKTNIGTTSTLDYDDYKYKVTDLTEEWLIQSKASNKITLERFVGYGEIYSDNNETNDKLIHLADVLGQVKDLGYEALKENHKQTMSDFWEKSDVKIEGDNKLQIGLRFNIFHLNQTAGRNGKTNISAKGITGAGYEGHYFWDTEMYMLPFFIYTQPDIARKLLEYRHSILPSARNRAHEMAVEKGALFAWRTINGEEASAYYPAGTAQVHINADIAHGVYTYFKATNDKEFAFSMGLEILIETARFWVRFGHHDPRRNHAFVINGVTGPDEYTAIVDNNYYTNIMAKNNLKYAIELVQKAIEESFPESKKMLNKINFDIAEVEEWKNAEESMYLPYDEEQHLTMQDDQFFNLKKWDLENTPKEKYPLLLHYHPLTIYRHQVNKQADTVLAQFMFPWEFDLEQKIRDYNYYEAITTHDSSLSRSIFSMMASEIGNLDKAYSYFMDTALMDLTDMQGNTKDGVHVANMGGTWMSLVYGFAGMRLNNGYLHFAPKLPNKWTELIFKIQYKENLIEVNINKEKTTYRLLKGHSVTIYSDGKKIELTDK